MPYFIYHITPERKLEHLETFEKFQEAKAHARKLRIEQSTSDSGTIKIMFANTLDEAERLLKEKREAPPSGVNEEF